MEPIRQQRLDEVAAIAVRLETETGFPAPALIAQWAAESKWGTRPVGRNNCFGIKRAPRHAKGCVVTTHEVIKGESVRCCAEFADYDSLEESCRDYVWTIQHVERYASGWHAYQQNRDVAALQQYIAASYATDPNYAIMIRTIAMQGSVQDAIRRACRIKQNVQSA